jgi:formate-dependent nitrite reductase cytochrome c552 subunit
MKVQGHIDICIGSWKSFHELSIGQPSFCSCILSEILSKNLRGGRPALSAEQSNRHSEGKIGKTHKIAGRSNCRAMICLGNVHNNSSL